MSDILPSNPSAADLFSIQNILNQVRGPRNPSALTTSDNLATLGIPVPETLEQEQVRDKVLIYLAEGCLNYVSDLRNNFPNLSENNAAVLVAYALSPLIFSKNWSQDLIFGLLDISSYQIAILVERLRAGSRSADRKLVMMQLVRELQNTEYEAGIFRIINILKDNDNGQLAISALLISKHYAENHHFAPTPMALLKWIGSILGVGAVSQAAIHGVVGNRADQIVLTAWEYVRRQFPDTAEHSQQPTNVTTTNSYIQVYQDKITAQSTAPVSPHVAVGVGYGVVQVIGVVLVGVTIRWIWRSWRRYLE